MTLESITRILVLAQIRTGNLNEMKGFETGAISNNHADINSGNFQ
jgi:hypothetical protein